MSLLLSCGGGADIGNPEGVLNYRNFIIEGCVKKTFDEGASNATVILGRYSEDPISSDGKDTVISDGLVIVYNPRLFDTTTCDMFGNFYFNDVASGVYVIIAEQQKKNGIVNVSTVNGDVSTTVDLHDPVDITIKTYTPLDKTNPYFTDSRIAGTPLVAKADSAGVILFKSVPSGLLDIVLYKSDTTRQTFKDLFVSPVSGAILMVDPKRDTSYWTAKTDPRDPNGRGRPYVVAYGISNDSSPILGNIEYDLYIKFSHSMDPVLTSKALHIGSSDSTIQIDEIIWQNNWVFLRLCVKDSAGVCNRDRLSNISSFIVRVDTLARTDLDYQMAWPEVFEVKR
jgi:hypothetical protein